VRQYLLRADSIVIAGTHGKTTTSALIAWLLLDSGRDPGFLVGGEMRNLSAATAAGQDRTSCWKATSTTPLLRSGPSSSTTSQASLHRQHRVRPRGPLCRPAAVVEAFEKLVAIVPPDGVVVANRDDARVAQLLPARARVVPCRSRIGGRFRGA